MNGERETAIQALNDRIRAIDPTEGVFLSQLIAALAFVHQVSGDLAPASVNAQQLGTLARESRMTNAVAWSSYLQGWSCFHAHDLAQAAHHFEAAARMRYMMDPRAALDSLAGLALVQQLARQKESAVQAMNQLLDFAQELNSPISLSVAHSCRARLSVLQRDLTEAVKWARSFKETPEPSSLLMWLEAPSITRARIMVAVGSEERLGKSTEMLRTLRQITEAHRFGNQTIEIAVLQSLALERLGRADEALKALEEALAMTEPRGWIRPFVESGRPMADLLKRAKREGIAADYVGEILAAFGASETEAPADAGRRVDPLTNREEEILELLNQRLRDKEIADKLCVSGDTVKYHLRHIYEKLGVGSRLEAVAKARSLGLLMRD
jgi:LuxR family maltose regulon positive regulatory protein